MLTLKRREGVILLSFLDLYCSDKRCIIIMIYYLFFYDINGVLIMEYLTTVEMSAIWNITSRRIGVLCAEGRVHGAVKKGKTWLIPSGAVKPADGRYKKNTDK